jgi:hypothetical protein
MANTPQPSKHCIDELVNSLAVGVTVRIISGTNSDRMVSGYLNETKAREGIYVFKKTLASAPVMPEEALNEKLQSANYKLSLLDSDTNVEGTCNWYAVSRLNPGQQ